MSYYVCRCRVSVDGKITDTFMTGRELGGLFCDQFPLAMMFEEEDQAFVMEAAVVQHLLQNKHTVDFLQIQLKPVGNMIDHGQ